VGSNGLAGGPAAAELKACPVVCVAIAWSSTVARPPALAPARLSPSPAALQCHPPDLRPPKSFFWFVRWRWSFSLGRRTSWPHAPHASKYRKLIQLRGGWRCFRNLPSMFFFWPGRWKTEAESWRMAETQDRPTSAAATIPFRDSLRETLRLIGQPQQRTGQKERSRAAAEAHDDGLDPHQPLA